MKHLKLFFALFAMLALGVGNAWAESIEINTTSSGVNGSYRDYEFDVNSITFGCTQWMKNNNIQAKKSTTNSLYNVDAIPGTITSIVVKQTGTARAIKVYGGTSTKPTTQITSPSTAAEMTFDFTGKDYTYFSLTTPSNACYFDKITINYTPSSSGGDPEPPTPEPEPDPDPTPGTGGTGTINFNSNAVKIDAASVTGNDDLGNTWTITTVGTTSYTANSAYYQVGKSTGPATSITFTTTLPSEGNITAFSAKFGGFNGTAGTVTLKVDDTSVGTGSLNASNDVTVSNSSQATGKKLTVTVTGIAKGVKVYYISYTYTTSSGGDEPSTPTPSVSVAPTSHTFATTNVGETATQEFTITPENTTATLSASIDNTTDFAISAIADNKITVTYQPQTAKTHEATLTIKAGEEASTTVALTGKAVAALEGTWILVTDASSLKAGDEIIIAAKEYDVALSTTQNNNNRGEVAITKNQNTITATSETQVLTLQAGNKENTLALYTGDGYLYAASSSNNYLRTETTLSDNSSWTIAIADGTATLTAQGTNIKNTLYYNKNSTIFSCYSNTQQEIAIYKNTNGQQLAGLAYSTTKYLTKLGDAFTTPTLTNPNSLTVTYSSSDNNVATVDNTGTVTIKAAGVVVITAAFAGDASYLEGSAKYTLCVTEHAGTEVDPYSVADARRVIDVMETAEGVYATGIVSEIVTAYDPTYKNITYNISADGLTASEQLQAFRGKAKDGADFTSADDIKVGDEVVVKGNLKLHNGTVYEFDANNQLVSLKRDKQQAGLAYEEKEHTANVGEDFTEPTLTNPNSLTVTYSSSNTALATVDATTGEVSILAAGKVTITASSAADATYAAGSASYNITITDPSLAVAQLPFTYNSGKAAIETTAGMTQNGLGSDYSASTAPNSQLKFDHTGDWVVIRFDSEPGEFSFLLKQNGSSAGTFTVYESANGEDYTSVWAGGDFGNAQSETIKPTLSESARYVKFEYTTKPSGTNYGLGQISIKKIDKRQEAGLAWNPISVTLTQGEAFAVPTLQYPNDITGTITYESSNEDVATVSAEGVIALVDDAVGTAIVTAKFGGDDTYKAAEVSCTIKVKPVQEDCEGSDDFETLEVNSSYTTRTTTGGWKVTNAAVAELEGYNYIIINGKTSTVGTITSPELNGGIGSIKIRYANTYSESNGVSFKLDIKQNDEVVKTYTVTKAKAEVVQNTVYTELIEDINVEGDFVMVFTNLSPSKSTSNQDRVSIGRLCWTGYTAPVLVTPTVVANSYFSVGEGKFVQFSTGNLQYEVGTNTWSFASEQYEVIGGEAYDPANPTNTNYGMNEPGYTGKLDLFGWSSDDKFGVNPSNTDANYEDAFADWGNLVNEEGWYTLTKDEMNYILNRKKDGKKLWALATVYGMNGLILLPDNWNTSTTLEYGYVPAEFNYTKNQLDDAAWAALEANGAVFLPAGGSRVGGHGNKDQGGGPAEFDAHDDYFHVDNVGSMGYYWLNTQDTRDDYKNCASYLILPGWSKGATDADNDDICLQPQVWSREKRRGNSVRLVKKVTPDYTREVRPGYYGTICLQNGGQMIGASLFELYYYNEAQGLLYMVGEADATMEAGNPYVFLPNERATNNTLYVFYDETTATAKTVNGLVGYLGDENMQLPGDGTNYILQDNKIKKVVGGDNSNVFVTKNRAYIQLGSVDKNEPAPVPGCRLVAIGQAPQVATGMESVDASAQPVKMIIDGQLYILRGEKMYDAQGKLVK